MNEHVATSAPVCEVWSDHQFGEPRFLENGKHPTMGRFQRFTVTCERCQRSTTETRWLDLPWASLDQGAR